MNYSNKASFEFGFNILGPIFYDFCRKLYLYHAAYSPHSISFFAYRGGLRLLYLYNKYLKTNAIEPPIITQDFMISRILALKAAIRCFAYNEAEQLLLREYSNTHFSIFLKNFCINKQINIPESLKNIKLNSELLREAIFGDTSWAKEIKQYLKKQESLLRKYVFSLISGYEKILFVDTGWNGTTQLFLMKSFPELEWYGIYFGKWDTWNINPPHFHTISGLGVEGSHYISKKPETVFFYYHHIIEAPLEPNIPSVEHLVEDSSGEIKSHLSFDKQKILPQEDEAIFSGICAYFLKSKKLSIAEQHRNAYFARRKIRKKILFPSKKDIKRMMVKPRSADLGKKIFVPILYEIDKSSGIKNKIYAIQKSIWKQGKITKEFPVIYPIIHIIYNNRFFLLLFLRKIRSFQKKSFESNSEI